MALVGYQIEKQKIEDKIRAIEAQLKGKKVPLAGAPAGVAGSEGPKRILSPAARKRIAMAQKKRWAEHRRKAALAAKGQE
jgi:hypothetical protein